MRERLGVYPGTFDPVTNGHLDIIHRAGRIVDRLIVGVAANLQKGPMFSLEERIEMVRREVKGMPVEVCPFETLLVTFAHDVGAHVLIRGLRAVSDFEYEFKMCAMNRRLNEEIETVFLMASEEQQFVSSLFVKEVGRMGGDVSSFVPVEVNRRLKEYWGREKT